MFSLSIAPFFLSLEITGLSVNRLNGDCTHISGFVLFFVLMYISEVELSGRNFLHLVSCRFALCFDHLYYWAILQICEGLAMTPPRRARLSLLLRLLLLIFDVVYHSSKN